MDWMRRILRSTAQRVGVGAAEVPPTSSTAGGREPLDLGDGERHGFAAYGEATSGAIDSRPPELSAVRARAIMNLPEGSLYGAGEMTLFEDREVFEAAKVLAANGIDFSDFESRAAIISRARNDFPASYPNDALAGYYEDFPR